MSEIQTLVDKIRDWEMEAGEGFCDYFLDRYTYGNHWYDFLKLKGFDWVVQECEDSRYQYSDGTFSTCIDQRLKFETFSRTWEDAGGDWSEEEYRKDVTMWAEFILNNEHIKEECEKFLKEYWED